jgi:hypothetical protein
MTCWQLDSRPICLLTLANKEEKSLPNITCTAHLASCGPGVGFSQALIPLGVTRGFLGAFGDNLTGIRNTEDVKQI